MNEAISKPSEGEGALDRALAELSQRPVPDLSARLFGALTASGPAGAAPAGRQGRKPRLGLPWLVGVAASILVLLVAGVFFLSHGSPRTQTSAAKVTQVAGPNDHNPNYPGLVASPTAYPKPNVTLTDTSGRPYDLIRRTQGRITLVYFGYTHCPDVCPLNMALSAAALHDVPAAVASKVTVVFITTDPARDTPAVLRAWLDRFSPSFVGLTGTIAEIHSAEAQVGMPPSYAESNGQSGSYEIIHSGNTLIYTPDGQSHLFFDTTPHPTAVADALEKLAAHGYQA